MSHDKLPPTKIFNQFLTAVTASATSAIASAGQLWNMAINAAGTASGSTNFFISCPADTELLLHRALICIYDEKGMEDEEYGSLGASLSAGLELKVLSSDGTTVLADLTVKPIKSNIDWQQVCYDVEISNFTNTTNAAIKGRWTFNKGGNPIYLQPGQKLNMAVKDNLSALIRHSILIQGHKL